MTELRIIDDHLVGKKFKPNLDFCFRLAIPVCNEKEFALLVEHDGQNDANVNALLRLADEGKAPYCISIGVSPGRLTMPDGSVRKMRKNSYDLFDREYGDFLVFELIPYVAQKYSLSISPDPKMHIVSGGSSGGVSAFCVAWFHPDYFQKVYMSSPSFLAMGRGNEIPYLIRKFETKPLRIYEEYSENEPNDYFGASYPIDIEARMALEFANYDFACKYFPREGHCSRYEDEAEAYLRMQWLWREAPPRGNSPRVEMVIPSDSKWEVCGSIPENKAKIPMPQYDTVVRSNDGMAVYCANTDDDAVYFFPSGDPAKTEEKLLHTYLHTLPRFAPKGAIDMAVDNADRLYALTAMGIQCIRSYGLVDVILALPDQSKPIAIAVTDALYVKTELGIYRRKLQPICYEDCDEKRKFVSYYD